MILSCPRFPEAAVVRKRCGRLWLAESRRGTGSPGESIKQVRRMSAVLNLRERLSLLLHHEALGSGSGSAAGARCGSGPRGRAHHRAGGWSIRWEIDLRASICSGGSRCSRCFRWRNWNREKTVELYLLCIQATFTNTLISETSFTDNLIKCGKLNSFILNQSSTDQSHWSLIRFLCLSRVIRSSRDVHLIF